MKNVSVGCGSLMLMAVLACGGEETQTTFQTRVIAATGGTVTAGGATLTIPAGALSQDTTITVTTSSPSSSLPDSSTVKGLIFDLGPDGTTFSTPATLTLPMTGTATGERAVISFLDPIANRWVDAASTLTGAQVSAPVSHFTDFAARSVAQRLPGPTREWSFDLWSPVLGTFVPDTPEGGGDQIGDGLMYHHFDFGPANVFDVDGDGIAALEAYSSASGVTFWVSADNPFGGSPENKLVYGRSTLYQWQSFIKHSADDTLRFLVTEATMEGIDLNGEGLNTNECEDANSPDVNKLCQWTMQSEVDYLCWLEDDNGVFVPFSTIGSVARMYGWSGHWHFYTFQDSDADRPAWTDDSFDFNDDTSGDGGSHPLTKLKTAVSVSFPLASIPEETEFTVGCRISAIAVNARGRESGIGAYLRDPEKTDGVSMETTGLEATNRPVRGLPTPQPPPPCTSGPDPAAGVLQFNAASYSKDEFPFGGDDIVVTRTQGSTGAVSATFTTSDGTAVAGSDYTAKTATVHFADGDTTPRVVSLTILLDADEEPDRTVTLTLSDPGGCATLGAQSTAVLTILDDDHPPPAPVTFTIGGTVSGLVGTGLVLQNLGGNDLSPGNGAFAFTIPLASGIDYNVTVAAQPTNPTQVCTIPNGIGTVGNANITNILVTCDTPDPTSGLDPSFGTAGKVTIGLTGGATAMALQTDGKIVLVGSRTLARYKADGSLDTSFSGGSVTLLMNTAQAVAIQPDGGIVVAGFSLTTTRDDFAVERYDANGILDTSFGGGSVTTDFNGSVDRAWAVLVQTDGKIVVAGQAGAAPTSPVDNDFAVARYTSTGALDMSFGTLGKVTTNIAGRTDLALAAALQPDGGIVVAGRVSDAGAGGDVGLVRYGSNGSPDMGFGIQGIVRTNLATLPSDVALQPDGKILVAVQAVDGGTIIFGVVRFEGDGDVDTGFGNVGLATARFSTLNDYAQAVAVQSGGEIVVAGQSSNLMTNPDFGIARFTAGGTLDDSFGSNGMLTVDFFRSSDGAECAAIQTDGKIVVGGFARNGTTTGLGLARVLP